MQYYISHHTVWIMMVRASLPNTASLFFFITAWQYWLGIAKLMKATLNHLNRSDIFNVILDSKD